MEGDDGMNWDLQPEQVQPCRTADGRPVILGTGAYGNVSDARLSPDHPVFSTFVELVALVKMLMAIVMMGISSADMCACSELHVLAHSGNCVGLYLCSPFLSCLGADVSFNI